LCVRDAGIGGLQDVESECDALASLLSRLEDAQCGNRHVSMRRIVRQMPDKRRDARSNV
jgi:hypothetical protein